MRIFLVGLVAAALFVGGLLLAAAVTSPRARRALGGAQLGVWWGLVLLPAGLSEYAGCRWRQALDAVPGGWVAPLEAHLSQLILSWVGAVYAVGYLLGGMPPTRRARREPPVNVQASATTGGQPTPGAARPGNGEEAEPPA